MWRPVECDWMRLGEDLVVRSSVTGSAHLLEGDHGALFEVLAEKEQGSTVDALLEAFGESGAADGPLGRAFVDALLEFERCGLVVRIP